MTVASRNLLSASTIALIAGAPAFAQDFYVGAFAGYNEYNPGGGILSPYYKGEDFGVLGGVRFDGTDLGSSIPFFFGLEAEHSFGKYYDTTRFRALAGYSLGDTDLFVSAGRHHSYGFEHLFGIRRGDQGTTYGLGVQHSFSDRFSGRIEVLRDTMTAPVGYGPDFRATTVRAGAIFKF